MKRALLCFLIALQAISLHAQNWKTVQIGNPTYFKAPNHRSYEGNYYYPWDSPAKSDSVIRMAQIKSIGVIGMDSVFRFYTSFRDTGQWMNSYSACADTLAPSWLGKEFIRKSDGTEYYFNSFGDTITIKTAGTIGDTWMLAKSRSGLKFNGIITWITQAIIDGVLDSVKDIRIQAVSGTSNVPHPYNSMRFRISKDHGWLETLDMYRFPSARLYNENVGVIVDSTQHFRLPAIYSQGHKWQDIGWKYTPGNEWIWKYENLFTSNPDHEPETTSVRHDSIIAFVLISPGVGLATIRTVEYNATHIFSGSPGNYSNSSATTNTVHTDTVNDILSAPMPVPEASWRGAMGGRYYLHNFDSSRSFYTRANLYYYRFTYENGCMRLSYSISAPDDQNSFSTWLPDFGATGSYRMLISGIPQLNKEEYGRYIYIKTGATSYGSKINVAKLTVGRAEENPSFRIAPNPANDYLTITTANYLHNITATLRNLDGRTLQQIHFSGSKLVLRTADVPAGIYLLCFSGSNIMQHIKLIIRH